MEGWREKGECVLLQHIWVFHTIVLCVRKPHASYWTGAKSSAVGFGCVHLQVLELLEL